MKKIFSLFLLIANVTYGQVKKDTFHDNQLLFPNVKLLPPAFPDNLSNDFLKKDFRPVTPDLDRFIQKYVFINSRDMRTKFSHNTPNGSVYDLVYDDMPCLVPDTERNEKMPVRRLKNENPVDKMPNAVPRVNIIP